MIWGRRPETRRPRSPVPAFRGATAARAPVVIPRTSRRPPAELRQAVLRPSGRSLLDVRFSSGRAADLKGRIGAGERLASAFFGNGPRFRTMRPFPSAPRGGHTLPDAGHRFRVPSPAPKG